ncbi:hypothetical protein EK904_010069 [Melospiza melodia maxima]|nr:hypothetical protein EK904_010069 [Melospiza melodia maxima]
MKVPEISSKDQVQIKVQIPVEAVWQISFVYYSSLELKTKPSPVVFAVAWFCFNPRKLCIVKKKKTKTKYECFLFLLTDPLFNAYAVMSSDLTRPLVPLLVNHCQHIYRRKRFKKFKIFKAQKGFQTWFANAALLCLAGEVLELLSSQPQGTRGAVSARVVVNRMLNSGKTQSGKQKNLLGWIETAESSFPPGSDPRGAAGRGERPAAMRG